VNSDMEERVTKAKAQLVQEQERERERSRRFKELQASSGPSTSTDARSSDADFAQLDADRAEAVRLAREFATWCRRNRIKPSNLSYIGHRHGRQIYRQGWILNSTQVPKFFSGGTTRDGGIEGRGTFMMDVHYGVTTDGRLCGATHFGTSQRLTTNGFRSHDPSPEFDRITLDELKDLMALFVARHGLSWNSTSPRRHWRLRP
jgi:hypothetical protein